MGRLAAIIAGVGLLGASSSTASAAVAQASATSPDFQILGNHSSLRDQTKLEFPLRVPKFSGDPRSGKLTVICSDGLTCSPETQVVVLAAGTATAITAIKAEGLNSADISAQLEIDGERTLTAVRALDFGLWATVTAVGYETNELIGGESRALHVWLEDGSGSKIKVTSPIQVEMSSSDGCVELKTVNRTEKSDAKNFGTATSTTIKGWQVQSEGEIWIRPVLWTAGVCDIQVVLQSAGIAMWSKKLHLRVKPNYLPAFLMSCAGAGIQYLLAALMRIAAAARGGKRISLRDNFVGSNGVEIIETLLKGSFAFVLAFFLNTMELIQFKGADKSSLLGFGVFGFLIGFWQLPALWEVFRKFSSATGDASHPEADPPVGGAAPR